MMMMMMMYIICATLVDMSVTITLLNVINNEILCVLVDR